MFHLQRPKLQRPKIPSRRNIQDSLRLFTVSASRIAGCFWCRFGSHSPRNHSLCAWCSLYKTSLLLSCIQFLSLYSRFTINHSHPKLHISQPPQQQHQQVRAIHAFTGDPFANQLAFSAGTVLLVRDPTRTANGWAFGEVVDGMGRRTGWFPVNYVPPRRRPSRAVHGANVGGNQYRIAWRIFSIPLRPVGLVAAGALAAKHAMDSHNDRQNKPGS